MGYPGAEIYRRMNDNPATTQTLDNAQKRSHELAVKHNEMADSLVMAQRMMNEHWQGDGAGAATAGLQPNVENAHQTAGKLEQARLSMYTQNNTFHTARGNLVPMDDAPPNTNFLDSLYPFGATDDEKKAAQWNTDNRQNIQQYENYKNGSADNRFQVKHEYPLPAPPQPTGLAPANSGPPHGVEQSGDTGPPNTSGGSGVHTQTASASGPAGSGPSAAPPTPSAPPPQPALTQQGPSPAAPAPAAPANPAPPPATTPAGATPRPPTQPTRTGNPTGQMPQAPGYRLPNSGFGPTGGRGAPASPGFGPVDGGFGPIGSGAGSSSSGSPSTGRYSTGAAPGSSGPGGSAGGRVAGGPGGGQGPGAGGSGSPAQPGRGTGAAPPGESAGPARGGAAAANSPASGGRGAGHMGGMAPGAGGRGKGGEDEEHQSKVTLPSQDPDSIFGGLPEGEKPTPPVIGA